MRLKTYALGLAAAMVSTAHAGTHGTWFDPGFAMDAPAEGAPVATADASFLLGTWEVDYQRFDADSLVETGGGRSQFGFLNRGHAVVERLSCDECGPSESDLHELAFWVFNPTQSRWGLGVARSVSEDITVYDGPRAV